MNIDGVNSVSSVKASNSIKKSKNTSFKGHVLTEDNRGNAVYKFFLPNAPENTKLKIAVMSKDKEGYYKKSQNEQEINMPKGFQSVYVKASDYGVDENNFLGYKFIVNNKEYTDKGVRGDGNYTIAIPVKNSNSSRSRLMEHVFVDAFNVKNPAASKRNHFNILGGTLKSAMEKIPEIQANGIREILGNPIFGQDNLSSHGYWTTNAYQITNNLGNYKDFRKLMIMLYNRGMGWTADGAFVNEGIEGVHIKDIENWGEKSPFINMFETKDVENTQVRFGVLSKNDAVNKHIHIKLVNAPYKIVFEKTDDGYKEKEIVRNRVDGSKSTYIQLFDDRLASEEQINGDEVFRVYANKEAQDHYEIACSRDSVQPIHMRVKPSEVEANYEKYVENKKSEKDAKFKDFLTQWTNFNLVNSNKDGGVSLWVGNNDISKKRFILSDYALKSMKLPKEKQKEVISAQYQVQDDTVQIGKFWTGEVARILTEYTANELAKRVSQSELPPKEAFKSAILSMIDEKLIHKDAMALLETENEKLPSALDNILTISAVNGNRKYNLKPVIMPENITDGLMSYPLEAIEFSPDLTSVFAYPFVKNLAVSEETVGLSRYEMFKMGENYYNQMPEEFKETYKTFDEFYAEDLTQKASDIMKTVGERTKKILFEGDELTEEGREIYSLLAPDIMKFLTISSLAPEIEFDFDADFLKFDVKELQKYDLNKLNLQYETSPKQVAEKLLNNFKKGLNDISNEKTDLFIDHLVDRTKNIDSDAINVAKLIIDKTETGLDWRIDALKDVGDWDAQEAGRFSAKKNEKEIISFWRKFNQGVNKYNPNSVKIGELTDWSIDKSQFIERSKFDNITDYESFYTFLMSIYGQSDEGKHESNFVDEFYKQLENYFDKGIIDNLNFAHRFVGNHDKPRILHLLATDVNAFNQDKAAEVERVLIRGFESSEEFKKLDSKFKNSVFESIKYLKSGFHTVDGEKKEFDSENFGARPFDYTIEDVINEACLKNNNFKEFIQKNPEITKKIKAQALQGILEPAISKLRSIIFAMVALPGTPTIYAGDELGMTGWETFCKNEKQENRNAVRWDWLEDDNYKFIQDNYKNVITPLMRVRNLPAASALVNGTLQPLHSQNLTNNGRALAFYRYNDKTDAIAVLHGCGYGSNPLHKGIDAGLKYINLNGLPNSLEKDTIYVDALDFNKKFKVVQKNIKIDGKDVDSNVIVALDGNGNESDYINLGNAGLILLRESDFNGNKIAVNDEPENTNTEISKKQQNPHVKLANLKFDFSYMNN